MECSNCGSPSAQIRIRVSEDGEKKVCLCDKCFEKLYPKSDALELFSHLFGSGVAQTKKRKACPSCGMTLESFRKTGLLGCTGCYTAFRSEINQSLRYCQWDSLHRGKKPSDFSEEIYDLVREQEYIRSQIDKAFTAGDYRRAEELTRRLQEIHAKLSEAGEA